MCLFATANKMLSPIILDQLWIYVANDILPELQRGFRNARVSVHMISTQHL